MSKENVQFNDEEIFSLNSFNSNDNLEALPIEEETYNIPNPKGNTIKEPKEPYKNMKIRKIVLLIGFIISFVGFALMAFSLVSLLVPNNFATVKLFIPIDIAACATSFVGAVFAVAGANTKKSIARLSFFFVILGFVIAAAMLVIMYASQLLPLKALDLSLLS